MDSNGQPDYSKPIAGEHYIADVEPPNEELNGHPVNEAYGHYSGSVVGFGVPDTCYKAHLDVTGGWIFGPSKHFKSMMKCVIDRSGTPIVFDLGGNGFHLGSPSDPVSFDIDADGDMELLGWTGPDSDEAFLCQDRNGDGAINDGSELWGDATPSQEGPPLENGFDVLAELDEPAHGGNGNGKVDSGDSGFDGLCLWADWDRSGTSTNEEIFPLSAGGVVAINLRYVETNRTDQHGNLFFLKGSALVTNPAGQTKRAPIYDVIFASASGE